MVFQQFRVWSETGTQNSDICCIAAFVSCDGHLTISALGETGDHLTQC
ncbi:Uncharacterised protein [Mycobacteroides abscessus subsp. abscessus]|nr:Uncharacterised protein [Mycobacteroides abscessus subsp. abscessus]